MIDNKVSADPKHVEQKTDNEKDQDYFHLFSLPLFLQPPYKL